MAHNPYSPPNAEVADIDEHANVLTPAANLSRYDYGGFWVRALAALMDTVILIPLQLALEYVLQGSIETESTLKQLLGTTLISFSVWCVYCTACWSSPWQATPGKLACGLRVTTAELNRLSVLHAFGRYWASALSSTIVIGVFFVPFTEKRQALHDLLARTVVPKRDALRRVGK